MAIRKVTHRTSYTLCPALGCLRTGVAVPLAWHSSGRQPCHLCSASPGIPCLCLLPGCHCKAEGGVGLKSRVKTWRRVTKSAQRVLWNSSTCEEKLFMSKGWTSRFGFYETEFGISFPLQLLCWMNKVGHSFCYAEFSTSLGLINNSEVFTLLLVAHSNGWPGAMDGNPSSGPLFSEHCLITSLGHRIPGN